MEVVSINTLMYERLKNKVYFNKSQRAEISVKDLMSVTSLSVDIRC